MRITLVAFIVVLGLSFSGLYAQSAYTPLSSQSMYLLDRFEIKSGRLATPEEFTTSGKAYKRSKIANYVDSFPMSGIQLSKQDLFNLDYLQNDNFEWTNAETTRSSKPIARYFFKHKSAALDRKDKEFNLVVNPVAYLQTGYDTRLKSSTSYNLRGLEIRGSILGTVGFYTRFTDVIDRINSWETDMYKKDTVIAGAGTLKTFDYKTFNYWLASGYMTFDLGKHIDVQFGHGRNFLGNGYRSFYISDFSRDHLYLRINTHFWKINYTNIWGMIYDYTKSSESVLPKRHYYATTHLSMNVTKKLNIGLFQTISYQRDSGYAKSGVELEYLNPIIFYKAIENGLNSPDKAILGIDAKYNFANHFSAYGQFVISEFVLHNVLAGNGWWANKQAFQLGLKYIDVFGINNLDVQLENNICRPYMYTSFDSKNAWVNYNQNMAHPFGANFNEMIGIVRFQPLNRLFLKTTAIYCVFGNDTGTTNWGKDIRMGYGTRMKEFGNTIAQGIRTSYYMFDITASWMVKHNLFFDIQLLYRKTSSDLAIFNTQTTFINAAMRWNINEKRLDF